MTGRGESAHHKANSADAASASFAETRDANGAFADLQNLVETAEVAAVIFDDALRLRHATPFAARFVGVSAADVGRPVEELNQVPLSLDLPSQARAALENRLPIDREVEIAAGRWLSARFRPYQMREDAGVIVVFTDSTERKQLEQRVRLLTAELDHRVKNVLAHILAFSQISSGPGREAAIAPLVGRIRSMARTHALLSNTQWAGASLGEICAGELDSYRAAGRARISGPNVFLCPDAAQATALVVHELTTNAVKHGALSVDHGYVEIVTALAPDQEAIIRWKETGGPRPTPKPGYGMSVIRESLVHDLDAKVDLSFETDGVRCEIVLPWDVVGGRSDRGG